MGAPSSFRRTVVDAAEDLIRAAETLKLQREHADRIVASLEVRWAANRVRASAHSSTGGAPGKD